MTFTKRLQLTGIVTIAIWTLLLWNLYHGGVPSHHILAREDLPEISNWWGGIVLPLLTWLLLYRIQKRQISTNSGEPNLPVDVVYGFLGALLLGTLLAVSFSMGLSSISGYLVISVFLFAFFFPVYRAEYLLGFVLSMTFTFGAILPTGIGSILLLIGLMIHKYIRTGMISLFNKARKQ